jgi:hypothetical protein
MRKNGLTLGDVRRWPPTVDVSMAAEALGVSRSSLYTAIAAGDAPVAIIRVNRRMKVLTSSLIELLEGSTSQVGASA